MKPHLIIVTALSLSVLFGTAGVAAQGNSEGKSKPGKEGHNQEVRDLELIFGGISVLQARELVRQHGATGGKPLPPGIRKNLARGKPLPPGIAHSRNLSEPLLQDLPYHEGYEWRRAGADLVLVAVASELIADVLVGVFD